MEAMPTVSSSVEKLPQIPHISLTQRHQTIRHPEKCSKPENDAICGLAALPYVHRALLNKAIRDARDAFSGWGAVPFGRRKAILASLLNKIDDHADELSALLTAEQGGPLAQARWEIDLLTKAFGPALMQMEPPEKEQDV